MRQPRRRKAGTSLAIDKPAKARIGVDNARKLIFPVIALIDAANGKAGKVSAIPTNETQMTAGNFRAVRRYKRYPARTTATMIAMPARAKGSVAGTL